MTDLNQILDSISRFDPIAIISFKFYNPEIYLYRIMELKDLQKCISGNAISILELLSKSEGKNL